MRLVPASTFLAVTIFVGATSISAQALGVPSGLAAVELERSRACVGVMARVQNLNDRLEPLARRSQRLTALSQAIALEDRSLVDPLDAGDRVEARVQEWFTTDAGLARRYVSRQDPSVAAERSAGRETIKATVSSAIQEVQTEANALLDAEQELIAEAAPCDGAIFVRDAVVEACAEGSGPICDEVARPASEATAFRFVDTPESIWEIEEVRPWTTPSPLRAGQGGLEGGRTIGYARVGNAVVSAAFTPLLRPRGQTSPELLASYEATNDSLGLSFSHPVVAFTPGLGLRVALPEPLGNEEGYVVHFGPSEDADVVWTGSAGTGAPLEATVALSAAHVRRLVSGDPLTLTAVEDQGGEPSAGYAIVIGPVNQAQAAQRLLGYMASQLSTDLATLVPPPADGP